MAESLFDNRYRYDYIYPRGRSGETLRALDSQSNNRKVVIKRPALNDAPPIRAGQEVSINNERRALNRLAGHPILTELLGEGQFFVGGMPHQYIVMERAEGLIIGEEVLRLNASGERLPELEMLVIVEQLLDLLRELRDKAGTRTGGLMDLLLDVLKRKDAERDVVYITIGEPALAMGGFIYKLGPYLWQVIEALKKTVHPAGDGRAALPREPARLGNIGDGQDAGNDFDARTAFR